MHLQSTMSITLFLVLLVPATLPATEPAKKPAVEDFRKGITCQKDWIARYKETLDWRILKILAHRAGKVMDADRAQDVSARLRKDPGAIDKALSDLGIVVDFAAFEAQSIEEWKTTQGDQALVQKTPHYLILARKQDERLAKLLAFYMEKAFALYSEKFKVEEKIEGRFLVKVYADQAAFRAGTKAAPFMFAIYCGWQRTLAGYSPDKGNADWNTRAVLHAFFHEGFHQFFHYFVPDPPTWLDEGLADYFAMLVIEGERLVEGKDLAPGRFGELSAAVKKGDYTPLDKLLHMSQKEFYAKPDQHYVQAWSLVHFLAFGNPDFRAYYTGIITHLKNGMEQDEAVDAAFAKVDDKKLDAAWKSYVQKFSPLTRSDRLVNLK